MKKINLILLISCLFLSIIFTGIANAQQGNLVVWVAASQEEGQNLVQAFSKHYPNINVDMIRAGSGELLTRLMAEQPNPNGDIIIGIAKEAFEGNIDLFAPYKTKNDAQIPANLKDRRETPKYYGFSMPLQAIMVNTDLLAPEDYPKTWKDLALPKYKGQIVLANPALSGSAYSQFYQMYKLYGLDFIKEVIVNTTFVTSSSMVPQSVARGEYAIGATGEYNIAQHIDAGDPVIAVYPEDGTGARFDASGIIANGPNPENAKLFMDFLTSKEAYEIVFNTSSRRTVHPEVPAPGALPLLNEIKLVDYDDVEAAKIREELTMKISDLIQ
ncbi:MAG: ABC transporter substrate-binding protein [Candidatus Caldatribacteriota bacterium]